jgi:hypothetical protein
VLDAAVRHPSLRTNPMPRVFYEALRTFTSSTDQRVVLTGLLEARRLNTDCLELLFQHVPRMGSDTDARVVLQVAARTQRIEGHAREAFLAATRAMESDTDRTVALSALMDLDDARTATGVGVASLDQARAELEERTAALATQGTEAARTTTTTTTRSEESLWNADISLDISGRDIVIRAKDVVFGRARWDVRSIRRGGELLVQETRGGVVRRLRAVPGRDGAPVYTYTVDGRARTFDPGAHSWFEALVHEFTGD